jgi:hypothetical protein
MPKKRQEREIWTFTVTGSQALARPDGRAAILLQTAERGPIAFEVTLQTIPLIRAELDRVEAALRQPVGNA